VMRRRREPQLEDALIEHPLGALAALAACVLIASCFFSIFVSKLWAIALGLSVSFVLAHQRGFNRHRPGQPGQPMVGVALVTQRLVIVRSQACGSSHPSRQRIFEEQ
jgi:hypothetical protein